MGIASFGTLRLFSGLVVHHKSVAIKECKVGCVLGECCCQDKNMVEIARSLESRSCVSEEHTTNRRRRSQPQAPVATTETCFMISGTDKKMSAITLASMIDQYSPMGEEVMQHLCSCEQFMRHLTVIGNMIVMCSFMLIVFLPILCMCVWVEVCKESFQRTDEMVKRRCIDEITRSHDTATSHTDLWDCTFNSTFVEGRNHIYTNVFESRVDLSLEERNCTRVDLVVILEDGSWTSHELDVLMQLATSREIVAAQVEDLPHFSWSDRYYKESVYEEANAAMGVLGRLSRKIENIPLILCNKPTSAVAGMMLVFHKSQKTLCP